MTALTSLPGRGFSKADFANALRQAGHPEAQDGDLVRRAMQFLKRKGLIDFIEADGHWCLTSLGQMQIPGHTLPLLPADTDSTPDNQAQRQAILGSMRQIIDSRLTKKQKTALLSEMKGMPQDEIARGLGSNRNAIYKLTHDARKNLKKGLEALGYTAEDVLATFAN